MNDFETRPPRLLRFNARKFLDSAYSDRSDIVPTVADFDALWFNVDDDRRFEDAISIEDALSTVYGLKKQEESRLKEHQWSGQFKLPLIAAIVAEQVPGSPEEKSKSTERWHDLRNAVADLIETGSVVFSRSEMERDESEEGFLTRVLTIPILPFHVADEHHRDDAPFFDEHHAREHNFSVDAERFQRALDDYLSNRDLNWRDLQF
jgi:hypothetical protein